MKPNLVEKDTFTPYETIRILESMNQILFKMRMVPVTDFECFLSLMPIENSTDDISDQNLFI